MKKKSVKMVASIAVLAILCGTYFGVKTYVSRQEEKEDSEEEAAATNIFSASADEIKALRFIIDKTEVDFEKDDETWVKKDETGFPVNQTKLGEAITAVESVDADRILSDVGDLSQYGLDLPSNTIVVATDDDKETVFHVGSENTSTGQYYVSMGEDDTRVYVVDSAMMEPFTGSLYDYAQMGEFPTLDSTGISKIKVEGNDSGYTLEKDADTELWSVSDEKETDKADSARASTLTSSLSSVEYASFVNYNAEDLSEYGLNRPYSAITVDYEEKAAETAEDSSPTDAADTTSAEDEEPEKLQKQLVIHVGDEATDDTRYVCINDSKEIYTISNETLSAITDKSCSDLWDLTVNYLSVNSLDQLDVTYENSTGTIEVSRETFEEDGDESESGETDEAEGETITYKMNGSELDSTSFTTFYNKLISLTGQKRLTEEYTAQDAAEIEISFKDLDEERTDVEFYGYDTNFYAAVVGEKVYLVNKMSVKDMITAYCEMTGAEEAENTDIEESPEIEATDDDGGLDSNVSDTSDGEDTNALN